MDLLAILLSVIMGVIAKANFYNRRVVCCPQKSIMPDIKAYAIINSLNYITQRYAFYCNFGYQPRGSPIKKEVVQMVYISMLNH